MSDWLLFIVFTAITLIVPLGILWLFRRRTSQHSAVEFYHTSIGGSRIAISKDAFTRIAGWVIAIVWLDQFVPIPFFLPLLIIGAYFWVSRSASTRSTAGISQHSGHLVGALQEMQNQIDAAKSHIEQLASEIYTRQIELEENEKLRTTLRADIEKKLSEVEAWKALTEQQKELFVQAAKEAISRRTSFQMLGVVLGSIALNLAASAIWALMGSPGEQQFLRMIEEIRNLVP